MPLFEGRRPVPEQFLQPFSCILSQPGLPGQEKKTASGLAEDRRQPFDNLSIQCLFPVRTEITRHLFIGQTEIGFYLVHHMFVSLSVFYKVADCLE